MGLPGGSGAAGRHGDARAANLAIDAGEAAKAGQSWQTSGPLPPTWRRRLAQGAAGRGPAAPTPRSPEALIEPGVVSAGDGTEDSRPPAAAPAWRTSGREPGTQKSSRPGSSCADAAHQAVVPAGGPPRAALPDDLAAPVADEVPVATRAALELWLDTANRALLETQRSERYLASQAPLLKRELEYRLAQRTWPSIREMFETAEPGGDRRVLSRLVHDLRRELRALQRQRSESA